MANHMKEVAKILGVKMGEEFKVGGCGYHIDGNGLIDGFGYRSDKMLGCLLTGEFSIENLPWKPQMGDAYWFIGADGGVTSYNWNDDYIDYSFYCAGNCFKTKESALEHEPEIIEKLKSFYENGGATK